MAVILGSGFSLVHTNAILCCFLFLATSVRLVGSSVPIGSIGTFVYIFVRIGAEEQDLPHHVQIGQSSGVNRFLECWSSYLLLVGKAESRQLPAALVAYLSRQA